MIYDFEIEVPQVSNRILPTWYIQDVPACLTQVLKFGAAEHCSLVIWALLSFFRQLFIVLYS